MMNNQPRGLIKTLATGLITLTLYAGSAAAAEVTGHSPDKTGGRILGGWTAFLIGGAAAGPVGAIVAGLGGAWAGGEVQEASGNSGQLHRIRTDSGETLTLRSPGRTFAVGEQVSIDGMRPRAANGE
ncbi:MAG: hypothetical protein RLP45_17110 [Haliea sp.]